MGATMTTMTYNETGKWRENLDLEGWAAEMRAIEKEFKAPEHFEEDVKHLKKILTWANLCYFGGLAALTAMPMVGLNMPAWLNGMNPIAAFMMSTAICARWTMVGHHTCHGGYNAAQSTNGEVTGRFHRRKFARGLWRRCTDWMDWMLPKAALAWFMTSVLADVMTNVHSFIIIATNHVGYDIYRFETETKPRSDDFYLRAVIGSANFKTGGDANDFMHGWLNYQ